MKIDRITLTHVQVPLVEPFRISNGEVSLKDGIIVRVYSEGLVGIGESSPMGGSFYSDETPETAWECLRNEIVPLFVDADVPSIPQVNEILGRIPGNSFARAGMETAFWDLEARRRNEPLYQFLGATRNRIESGLAVGIYPSVPELLHAIEHYLGEGYKRLKIKIQPGWDLEPLAAVRKQFGALALMVDANCAYTEKDIEHLKRLDDFNLMMVEQPLPKDDLEGHAKLQKVIKTPVCLDEGAKDVETVRRAIAMHACRIINIKIQRVGGLQNARQMHNLCMESGIPVWGGTMPELGIGGAQTVHLAALPNFTYPTDVESSRRWFVDDIVDPLIEVHDGCIAIPSGPGNAFRLNESVVGRFKVREERFS